VTVIADLIRNPWRHEVTVIADLIRNPWRHEVMDAGSESGMTACSAMRLAVLRECFIHARLAASVTCVSLRR
jgi:hypothetical protein